jgi:hypothetical protein
LNAEKQKLTLRDIQFSQNFHKESDFPENMAQNSMSTSEKLSHTPSLNKNAFHPGNKCLILDRSERKNFLK